MNDLPSEAAGRILLIDDEEIMHDVLGTLLTQEGHAVEQAFDGLTGLDQFTASPPDLVLLDLMLPGMGGIQVLEEIRRQDPHAVVIMLTAFGTIETAVQATKRGAYDFIAKPFKNEELLLAIQNGLHQRQLLMENLHLRQRFQAQYSFDSIIGKSHQMQEVFRLIQQVAPTRSTILVTGESGTGKELVAKAIHNSSTRAQGPFIAINCGNIPAELLESELFGYKKGAFTGALATKKGLFEIANRGTIFLDEISNISLELQAKLLRVIQEKEFRRLGDVDSFRVDVRILAATNEDLQQLARQGRFREDLFYRLNVIKIDMPPLRQRKEDIPLLTDHFIRRICQENECSMCTVRKDAMTLLLNYNWPGNVRELENVIERAIVLSDETRLIGRDALPPEMVSSTEAVMGRETLPEGGLSLRTAVQEYERRLILRALRQTSGNQKQAAQLLQLNATTLNEKIKRLSIDPLDLQEPAAGGGAG